MTGYDYPDWQPAALAADNLQDIDSIFNHNIVSGNTDTTAAVDTRQFTSVVLRVFWEASNQFEYLRVVFFWLDAGSNQVWQETVYLNPVTAVNPGPAEAYIRVPCRGVMVSLGFTNVASVGVLHRYTYSLQGSFRPVDRMQVVEAWQNQTAANKTDGTDGTLISLVDSKVASTDYPMAPRWGEVYAFLANAAGATVNLTTTIVDPISGQAVAGTAAMGAGGSTSLSFRLAARPYILRATAAGAGTIKPVAFVIAAND